MRIIVLIIILGLIAIIPNGIWISIGILLIWAFYKIRHLKIIQIELIKRKQDEYDDEILEKMK